MNTPRPIKQNTLVIYAVLASKAINSLLADAKDDDTQDALLLIALLLVRKERNH